MYHKIIIIFLVLLFSCKEDPYRTYQEIKNNSSTTNLANSQNEAIYNASTTTDYNALLTPTKNNFSETLLTYELPKNWKETPSGKMVMKTFVVNPQTKNSEGKVTLSVFPGDVGGVSANVNRWARQIKLTDPTAIQKVLDGLIKKQGKMPYIYVSYLGVTSGHDPSTLSGIFRFRDKSLFVKFVGHHHDLEANQVDFIDFLKSIK